MFWWPTPFFMVRGTRLPDTGSVSWCWFSFFGCPIVPVHLLISKGVEELRMEMKSNEQDTTVTLSAVNDLYSIVPLGLLHIVDNVLFVSIRQFFPEPFQIQ